MDEAYRSNTGHLQDELRRLDLMIQCALEKRHTTRRENELPGLIISEEEIASLLTPPAAEAVPSSPAAGDDLNKQLKEQTLSIQQRISASEQAGLLLHFPCLSRIFGLTAFEVDVILVCLAPELDTKYQTLYGYLQDDVTKKHPTFALIGRLLCFSFDEMIQAREFFLAGAPLFKYSILTPGKEAQDAPDYLLTRPLALDARITGFLTGSRGLDPVLGISASVILPGKSSQDTSLSQGIHTRLVELTRAYLEGAAREKLLFYFYGPDEEGKKQMAAAVCGSIDIPLLCVDLNGAVHQGRELRKFFCSLFRESLLRTVCVFLEHADGLWAKEEEARANIKVLQDIHREMGWITFLSGQVRWPGSSFKEDECFFEFEFPVLPADDRIKYWKLVLNNGYAGIKDADLAALAARFRFTRSQIRGAALAARNCSRLRDGKVIRFTTEDLYTACRSQSNRKLLAFGRKIAPRYAWKDIVLPGDILSQLQELCMHVTHHTKVFGEWGFDARHSLGKGLNILFSGTPGTGKTMAAEVMAHELKLDLYKIDLSNVVSKYIGETEKNLSRIFYEAETSNAILFFDEADALFGKRSEVKDSHDRYANIEINYLLQKMEEQEGIVILATNMSKNIDNAFLRRLRFFINFPLPGKEERFLIWKAIFPGETPLAGDVDYQFLARNLEITGGIIKNIATRAAFMAAGDSCVVNMKHIILASKREFQKIGKLCLEADFKEYFDLVR